MPRHETQQVHRFPQNIEFDKHLSHFLPNPFVEYFIPRKINEGEAESNESIDLWIKAEVGERMAIKSMDKGEAILDVIKTLVEECKAQVRVRKSYGGEVWGEDVGKREEMRHSLSTAEDTNLTVEIKEKEVPIGIMKNTSIQIDKFSFLADFLIMDLPDKTILLGTPFLETIHAQIDVFRKEITLGTENETVKFNKDGKKCQKADISTKDVCMTNFVQEEEDFNPLMMNDDIFSYESPACLKYNEQIRKEIHSINSSDKNIHDEKKPKKTPPIWHCCKLVHAMNEAKEWGTWPTCNPNSSVCSGDN
ncbi:copia protein, partial [Tanacetum coccineum]